MHRRHPDTTPTLPTKALLGLNVWAVIDSNRPSSSLKKADRDFKVMQRRIYEIFPSLEIPAALNIRPPTRVDHVVAQREQDRRLSTPRGGVSKRRQEIETARLREQQLQPYSPETPHQNHANTPRHSFFRTSARSGPLHAPDPERLKAALAMRAARQEEIAKHAGMRSRIISSAALRLRQNNVGAAARMVQELRKFQEFERQSAMSRPTLSSLFGYGC